ncbi:hypothetical protein B0H19DRAFT_1083948 [Mycena capillaripes]|nr:hypothetical protein B0H19DRAFT_1083948 [Mycena capillaripes]
MGSEQVLGSGVTVRDTIRIGSQAEKANVIPVRLSKAWELVGGTTVAGEVDGDRKHQGTARRRDGRIPASHRMAASSSQSLSVDYGEAYATADRSVIRSLTENSRFAAMEVESTINGVYQPGCSSSPEVETGKLVKYTGRVWSADTLYTPGPPLGYFAIQSDAAKPVEIILGSYSPGEQDAQQPYIPVVFLGPLNPSFSDDLIRGCEFHSTKPVYLQAYTTVNHRRENPFTSSSKANPKQSFWLTLRGHVQNFVIRSSESSTVVWEQKCAFQVYSHHNGEIALEMTVNQD